MIEVQTVVIGAGVVGLAVARALALAGREVIVLERADRIGTETSSRSSEVIHSGVYYREDSLKARLCVTGRHALYNYCRDRGILHRQTGKLIIAVCDAEIAILQSYTERAALNGTGRLVWCSAAQVHDLEPEVQCVAGVLVPWTGIVDSQSLMNSLWGDLQAAGGEVAFRSEVIAGLRLDDGRFRLEVRGMAEPLTSHELVNSVGLQAPAMARSLEGCGGQIAPESHYARGHYFALAGRSPFSRLVYPVAEAAGLGIHVTLDLAGNARFGPDVEWVKSPDYSFDESRRSRFAQAIKRYYPGLDPDRLRPGYVGIRPKIAPANSPGADFRIDGPRMHGIPGIVHLYGIESPGLTAALAIGDEVIAALDQADEG